MNFIKKLFKSSKAEITQKPDTSNIIIPPGISQEDLNHVLGLPIALFYLDQLPHAFANPENIRRYTKEELAERYAWLKTKMAEQDNPFLVAMGKFQRYLLQTAEGTGAQMMRLNGSGFGLSLIQWLSPVPQSDIILPRRLTGRKDPIGGIMLANDRRWTDRQYWSRMTSLPEIMLQAWPQQEKNAVAHAGFLHEVGHALQRVSSRKRYLLIAEKWRREMDADDFAAEQLAKQGFAETAAKIKMARALGGFLAPSRETGDIYQFMLAVDARERGRPIPSAQDCIDAMRILKTQVCAYLNNPALSGGATASENALFSASHLPILMIPALRDTAALLKTMPASGTLESNGVRLSVPPAALDNVRRTAELVLEAANYFCPLVTAAPVPCWNIKRPGAPPPGASSQPDAPQP